jgi:hypothetical protein
MNGTVSLLGIITVLAVSSFRSHRLNFRQTAQMAAAWVVIILALFLVLRWIGA